LQTKDVVAGLGEIGNPILKLFSKGTIVVGFDIDRKLVNNQKLKKYEKIPTRILHVCIPYNEKFHRNISSLNKKFNPSIIIIHSTIAPYTTKKIQKSLTIPVIYSATRGVHKRMLSDLKRYTKFYAIENDAPKKKWAISAYSKLLRKQGVKPKKMSSPTTLELAKIIVDTSYYGWLINYAQLSNMLALQHKVDYDEMWSFADEIHKTLGNRPKLFPGFIGGHCIIPNLELIDEKQLWEIDKINNLYAKKVKDVKLINKKYEKSKK